MQAFSSSCGAARRTGGAGGGASATAAIEGRAGESKRGGGDATHGAEAAVAGQQA
eukprot:CAMPEP_0203809932 /NCGR_PEP_ID=MMETSP0115-20131106/2626_1 /ASSEMBLY_ACC=CAM_ASM_000227 /TAXON_ID=33651 /ORGANISM="Bicosoecid sp, Strain ms1" /LENGTH=54 /DNA_ID=CAMNT_0050718699 /DNA_START=20 /DNA_END=180 /DNA_ORIENTATION=-